MKPSTSVTPDASSPPRSVLRDVPFMGVIFVVAEAVKLGFWNGHPDWCNLGQGQPEVGEMEGAPPRISSVDIHPEDHAYGPLEGTDELRSAIAGHYNRLFRQGKDSRYGPENVAVSNGGRLALSRAVAALGQVNVGYQLPDYTAYEDMLELHLARVNPMPIKATEENGFLIKPRQVEAAIDELGLGAFLVSNPCNPTGRALQGAELQELLDIGKRHDCTLLLDEFYSHFAYKPGPDGSWVGQSAAISAAPMIDDVEKDRVLLFDGLTKSFRYPGWRVGWILGPSDLIATIGRVASSMDGGPSRIAQRAALAALQPDVADQETRALREVFVAKRNLMVDTLREMGVRIPGEPESTFYVWGSLEDMPGGLDDGDAFFRAALQHKVMTVPGAFFDVDPGHRRSGVSPYRQWMRFSFGPPMDNMKMGLDRLVAMVDAAR